LQNFSLCPYLLHVKQSTFCPCLQVLTLCPDSYETVVHISGNDFHNGDILNVIYEKYESLLCQLLVMCQHDTVNEFHRMK
jgi:hypothetical protein